MKSMVKMMKFGKQRPPKDDEESLTGSKGSLEEEGGRHGKILAWLVASHSSTLHYRPVTRGGLGLKTPPPPLGPKAP